MPSVEPANQSGQPSLQQPPWRRWMRRGRGLDPEVLDAAKNMTEAIVADDGRFVYPPDTERLLRDLGLDPGIVPPFDACLIILHVKEGIPARTIAQQVFAGRIERHTVSDHLRRYGIRLMMGRPSAAQEVHRQQSYVKALALHRRHVRQASDAVDEEVADGPDAMNVERRRLYWCRKGNCKWLTPTCTRPPTYSPCPHSPGNVPSPENPACRKCTWYRAACDRLLCHCPYGPKRTTWLCDRCGEWVPIGSIHFVRQMGNTWREVKFPGSISRPETVATALCDNCYADILQTVLNPKAEAHRNLHTLANIW